jgi:MurNAc alpha-1-phosphate uridylyltransferase
VRIVYSDEQKEGALESAGGIVQALPLLGDAPFLVVNGDVWTDYPFDPGFALPEGCRAHLVLVPNPDHNPDGDFGLESGRALAEAEVRYTFSGIGYYAPSLFSGLVPGRSALGPLLRGAMREGGICAELYRGQWRDIGTPQRLAEIDKGER